MAGLLDDAQRALWLLSGGDPVDAARQRADARGAMAGMLPETEFMTAPPAADQSGPTPGSLLQNAGEWLGAQHGRGRPIVDSILRGIEPYGDAFSRALRDRAPEAQGLRSWADDLVQPVRDAFAPRPADPMAGLPVNPGEGPMLPPAATPPSQADAGGLPNRVDPPPAPTAARDASVPRDMILGMTPEQREPSPAMPMTGAPTLTSGGGSAPRYAGDASASLSPMSASTAAGVAGLAAPAAASLPPAPEGPGPYEPSEEAKTAAQDDALLRVAMAMMASQNPSFFGAVGEAGLQGVNAYDASLRKNQADEAAARAEQQRMRDAQLREYGMQRQMEQQDFQNQIAMRTLAMKEQYQRQMLARAAATARGGGGSGGMGRSTNAFTFFENERQRMLEAIMSDPNLTPQQRQMEIQAATSAAAELASSLARNPAKEDPLAALMGAEGEGGAAGIDPADLASAFQGLQ